jgi:hypothetical protein
MDKRDGFVETGVLTVVVIGHSSIHGGALVTCERLLELLPSPSKIFPRY